MKSTGGGGGGGGGVEDEDDELDDELDDACFVSGGELVTGGSCSLGEGSAAVACSTKEDGNAVTSSRRCTLE